MTNLIPQWKILYYVPQSGGTSPIAVFIENLPEKTQAKLSHTFKLLQDFGIQVGPPHVKKLIGTPLWELRILGQDNVRIIYFIYDRNTILLLHGFLKKKQKTDKRDLELAMKRYKESQFKKYY